MVSNTNMVSDGFVNNLWFFKSSYCLYLFICFVLFVFSVLVIPQPVHDVVWTSKRRCVLTGTDWRKIISKQFLVSIFFVFCLLWFIYYFLFFICKFVLNCGLVKSFLLDIICVWRLVSYLVELDLNLFGTELESNLQKWNGWNTKWKLPNNLKYVELI